MRLTFLGATGTVTGSRYLLEAGDERILVDCGLYQGVGEIQQRNWTPPPVDPATIRAVVLSHAHIDHSGYLPALVRDGFAGPVFCTPLTCDLCEILLPDAGRIQQESAAPPGGGRSRREAAATPPLYTEHDAVRALERLHAVAFDSPHELGPFRLRLRPAGHILGAASVELEHDARRLLFSGDLGRPADLLMPPPAAPDAPDWVVIESTYGDRLHPRVDPFESLATILRRTLARGGILLVPSFAVGRTQTLLYCLHEILRRRLAPAVPVFVDSPMATRATRLFGESAGEHRLSKAETSAVCALARYVGSPEESARLAARREPAVILSASGMASGGRVLNHLRSLAPHQRNTILFPGFQAPGTRGAAIVSGARSIEIHGRAVPVNAEVLQHDILSAHADRAELVDWLAGCQRPPRRVWATHGEPEAAAALRREIEEVLGYAALIPEHGESVDLA